MLKLFLCAAIAVSLLGTPAHASEKASKARQEEVAKRGAEVMPFSLERTLHIFTKTKGGGVQQVIVKDPSDTRQIKLIREHLSMISKEFAQGNFSDPASIHGSNMPGLKELEKARPGQLRIEYRELPDGAQIAYSSASSDLIDAIHRWFDAQLADHAGALPGRPGRNRQ
ncbi:MAG: aspartate carbamoyltransferase [Deltaproteobacteria bacterium]